TGLRSAAAVESLIARMDVVLTTRLHGLVLAIKNGVPAIAIDPIAGGAKVLRQANTIDWPLCFPADALDDGELNAAFDFCLTAGARAQARECFDRARRSLADVHREFLSAIAPTAAVR